MNQPKQHIRLNEVFSSSNSGKAWILPDGTIKPLPGRWHHQDLVENERSYKKRFGLDLSGLQPNDEQGLRMRALSVGFVRVNFEHRSHSIIIEALQKFWHGAVKSAAYDLVLENIDNADHLSIGLLNDRAEKVRSDYAELFRYDEKEKLEHLPLLLTEGTVEHPGKPLAKKTTQSPVSEVMQKALDGAMRHKP
jgi:hypothetical protein